VAVASAEPYAIYLHFAPEDNHASNSSLRFTGPMLFLTPNQQRQSNEGKSTAQIGKSKLKELQITNIFHTFYIMSIISNYTYLDNPS